MSIRMLCIRFFSVKHEIYSNKILLLRILHFERHNLNNPRDYFAILSIVFHQMKEYSPSPLVLSPDITEKSLALSLLTSSLQMFIHIDDILPESSLLQAEK